MSISATIVVKPLSSWCSPAIRLTCVPALPAVKTTRAGSCLLFAADRPTPPDKRAQGFHHPVHRPQEGFPEAAEHDRGSCEESRSKIGIYFFIRRPFLWVLFGFCLHLASGLSSRPMCFQN